MAFVRLAASGRLCSSPSLFIPSSSPSSLTPSLLSSLSFSPSTFSSSSFSSHSFYDFLLSSASSPLYLRSCFSSSCHSFEPAQLSSMGLLRQHGVVTQEPRTGLIFEQRRSGTILSRYPRIAERIRREKQRREETNRQLEAAATLREQIRITKRMAKKKAAEKALLTAINPPEHLSINADDPNFPPTQFVPPSADAFPSLPHLPPLSSSSSSSSSSPSLASSAQESLPFSTSVQAVDGSSLALSPSGFPDSSDLIVPLVNDEFDPSLNKPSTHLGLPSPYTMPKPLTSHGDVVQINKILALRASDPTNLDDDSLLLQQDKKGKKGEKTRLGVKKQQLRHKTLVKPPPAEILDTTAVEKSVTSFDQPLNPHLLKIRIMGPANAGKSTLMNHMIRKKISAVSPKSQTTRTEIKAIFCRENVQMIFRDTPGTAKNSKQRHDLPLDLVRSAFVHVEEDDVFLVVLDATIALNEATLTLTRELLKVKARFPDKHFVLVLNKADLVETREKIANRIRIINQDGLFDSAFSISALQHVNVEDLISHLMSLSKPADWLYPPELDTTLPKGLQALEVIREKIFRRVSQEVPYGTSLRLVGWTYLEDGTLKIDVHIFVAKKNHEKILVGAHGHNLSIIRSSAEAELHHLWGSPVTLNLVLRGVAKKTPAPADSLVSPSQREQAVHTL